VATPTSVFLTEGETKEVLVSATDDQGNPLPITLEASNVGPGITVVRDENYLPTTAGGQIQGTTRFLVTANTFVGSSFQVTTEGQTLTVPVRSLPVSLAGQFSNAAPALGETVTLTAPAGVTFGAETGLTFPNAQGDAVILGISDDSTVLSFLAPPGVDTTGFVSGLQLTYADGVPIDTLETTTKLTTPAVTFPASLSSANPGVNQAVTVTASGFSFLPTVGVVVGDVDTAVVVSRAADGSSISFLPAPGSIGLPNFSGVTLNVLPQVPLTLAGPDSMAVDSTVPTLAGTASPVTAPSLTVPQIGFSSVLYDTPDFTATIDHFYKMVVPVDGSYTVTANWSVGSDVDLILCNDVACSAPDFAAATGNQPESATYILTAGTYYVLVEDFGGDASGAVVNIQVTPEAPEAAE